MQFTTLSPGRQRWTSQRGACKRMHKPHQMDYINGDRHCNLGQANPFLAPTHRETMNPPRSLNNLNPIRTGQWSIRSGPMVVRLSHTRVHRGLFRFPEQKDGKYDQEDQVESGHYICKSCVEDLDDEWHDRISNIISTSTNSGFGSHSNDSRSQTQWPIST